MLKEIKEQLIEKPENIVTLLEEFDFQHISLRSKEIRFARDAQGGPNIRIRLEENSYLNVNDYARGVRADIFSYIIKEKGVTFKDVIRATKRILGLDDNWQPPKRRSLFGGIYQHIINPNAGIKLVTYDENVLDKYDRCGNQRFLHDGISLESQMFWNIRFSIDDGAIIIPIYNEYSELVGAKARINRDPEPDESKYYYVMNFPSSQVLYGYSENYEYLYGADVIYIGESEKFCQQLYTIGIRNCVSLGSHTLSEKHARLLMQLNPKCVCFMFDNGLNLAETLKNAEILRQCAAMREIDIKFFDHRDCLLLNKKDSPSDHGLEVWNDIVEHNIKDIKELEIELQDEKEVDY